MFYVRSVILLLASSAITLATMVPGGFVENRVFPDYGLAVLAGFNIFLTGLGLGSLILAYQISRSGKSGLLPICAGLAYALVYLADLAHVFPISTMPMSAKLTTLEIIGTVLGCALAIAATLAYQTTNTDPRRASKMPRWLLVTFVALAGAIVVFATNAAK